MLLFGISTKNFQFGMSHGRKTVHLNPIQLPHHLPIAREKLVHIYKTPNKLNTILGPVS